MADQGKMRQLEAQLPETRLKYEQTKRAMVQVSQALVNPPTGQLNCGLYPTLPDSKLDQLLVIMKSNQASIDRLAEIVQDNSQASIRNELIYQHGLTDILDGSLGFIKDKLTAVNGHLCLDGKKIENVAWFKKMIQTKPWVAIPGEYVIDCFFCKVPIELWNFKEDYTAVTCRREQCKKNTPMIPAKQGYRYIKCSYCDHFMMLSDRAEPGHAHECLVCDRRFVVHVFEDKDVVGVPRRK